MPNYKTEDFIISATASESAISSELGKKITEDIYHRFSAESIYELSSRELSNIFDEFDSIEADLK
jgi:hypothetical protein